MGHLAFGAESGTFEVEVSGGFETVELILPSNLLVQKSLRVCLTFPGDVSVADIEVDSLEPTFPEETTLPPEELSPTLDLAPTTIVPVRPKTIK